MIKLLFTFICALFMILSLSGCLGLVFATPSECKNETPLTDINDIFFSQPSFQDNFSRVFRNKPSAPPKVSTKAEFLRDWGKPNEIISTSDNEEIWIYKNDLWCGVIPVVILPVPLILPVCDGFNHVVFQDNKAKRLHTKRITLDGIIFPGGGGKNPDCKLPLPSSPAFSKGDNIPENAGLVIFYRSAVFGGRGDYYNVNSGETFIAPIFNGEYYAYLTALGEQEFWVQSFTKSSLTLTVKSGQTYYIKIESIGFPRRAQLVEVAAELAENEIANCNLLLSP